MAFYAGTVANFGTIAGLDGEGVALFSGGTVTNYAGGTIESSTGAAVYIAQGFSASGTGVVTNAGTIEGTGSNGTGIYLSGGGSVTNEAGGSISGGAEAIWIANQSGTVDNSGSLIGTRFEGIYLTAGGTISNNAGGYIYGGDEGVYVSHQPGTIVNAGTIQGGASEGVYMSAGGYVTNASTGLIQAPSEGIFITGQAGSVVNSGTIVATNYQGVYFSAGGTLTNANGGLVAGGRQGAEITGYSGTGASYGYITNSGTILGTEFQGIFMGVGGTVTNSGGLIQGASGILLAGGPGIVTNSGMIAGTSGTGVELESAGTVIDSGTISGGNGFAIAFDGSGSLLTLEHGYRLNGSVAVTGSGNTLELAGAAGDLTVDFSGFSGFDTIRFGDPAGYALTLQIDGTTLPTDTIYGFANGDTIDLTGIVGGFVTNGTIGGGNLLTITDGNNQTYTLQFDPTQSFAGEFFHTAADGGGGTLLTESNTPCFCRGTMILTETGQVAVEKLEIGDRVMTIAGEAKPIAWIGHGRRVLTGKNPEARPLIVRADAIAVGVPLRDLYLTRGHSLYIDGVLIPVEYLVNEHSILWDDTASEVEFYHLELQDHDVLLADGCPAESYRDDGNRHLFDNPEPPRFAAANMAHFAPVLTGGPEVDRIWKELLGRSGFVEPEATDDPDLHLVADGERIDAVAVDCRMHGHQGIYRFRFDRAPQELAIVSRSSRPMEMGINHDPRRLGVAVRSIELHGDGYTLGIDHGSSRLAEGFHDPEPGYRWTTGAGQLPPGALAPFDGPLEVLIDVGCTGKYPVEAEEEPGARAVA